MLKTLLIKNYALLVDEEIRFGDKLNILTGETGAGKTIILNALGTILGDRVNNTFVREGASKAIIEGIFKIEENVQLLNYLKKNDITVVSVKTMASNYRAIRLLTKNSFILSSQNTVLHWFNKTESKTET